MEEYNTDQETPNEPPEAAGALRRGALLIFTVASLAVCAVAIVSRL